MTFHIAEAQARNIEVRIARFRADLSRLSTARMVRKHITFGDCYILNDEQHFDLISEVAENFSISTNDVVLVGSAKTGFSIAEDKRYNHFGDHSDIDIAIVSQLLFDEIWISAYHYHNSAGLWPSHIDFSKYLFRGWIRPDYLPPSKHFKIREDWWDFFGRLRSSERFGPYKLRAGLYRTWHFLETYQSICVKQCQQDERGVV